MVAVGGCYAEAQRERIFEQYPFVDVAFGPGSIPHLGEWIAAGGYSGRARPVRHARALRRRPPAPQASAASRRGCRSRWAATRRARTASSLPSAAASRAGARETIVAEVTRLAASGVREITLLGQNVNSWGRDLAPGDPHRVRRAPARVRRRSGHRADPLHEPAPEGLPRARDRARWPECASVCEHVAPAGAVRLVADPQGDAANVRPRPLPPPRRPAALGDSRPRARHGPHRRVPGRDGRRLRRRRCRLVEEVGFDSAFTFIFSPRSGTEAATLPRSGSGRREARRGSRRSSTVVQRVGRRAERGARRAGRGGARRGTEPNGSDAAAGAHASQHDGELRRLRAAGELVDVLIDGVDLDDAARARGVARRGRLSTMSNAHFRHDS